jgi:hypothetical protein
MNMNCWVPTASCSQTPIPSKMPEHAIPFVSYRQDMSVYVKIDSQTKKALLVEGPFMIGPDCVPILPVVCSRCQHQLVVSSEICEDVFLERTYYGAVARNKISKFCVCGCRYDWDPSTEFIHTIRNNCEGG